MFKMEWTKEKTEWIALAVLGTVVLFVIGSVYFVRPGIKQKKVLLRKYMEKREEMDRNERMVLRKNRLKKRVGALEKQLEEISVTLPRTSGSFSTLAILNKNAQGADVVFERIEPREIPETKMKKLSGFSQKDYLLQLRSGFHQLGLFLNRLENASPFIQVQDIRIRSQPETPGKHEIQVIIRCMMIER